MPRTAYRLPHFRIDPSDYFIAVWSGGRIRLRIGRRHYAEGFRHRARRGRRLAGRGASGDYQHQQRQ